MQIEKYRRSMNNNQIHYLENIIKKNIENERILMCNRLKQLNGVDVNINDENVDSILKNEIEKLTIMDERGIKSDFSYNLAHIDEFRNVAISDYKM